MKLPELKVFLFYKWLVFYFLLSLVFIDLSYFYISGFLSFISFLITLYWLSYLSSTNKNNLLAASYWVFIYIFLIVAPLAQLATSGLPWFDYYNENELALTWFFIFLICSCSSAGFLYADGKVKKSINSLGVNKKRLDTIVIASGLIALICILKLGGFSLLLQSREDFFNGLTSDLSISMILIAGFRVPLYVCSLAYIYYLTRQSYTYKNLFISVALVSLVLFLNNPISTPRFWFGCIVLSYIFLILNVCYRGKSINYIVINLMLGSILFLFPIADIFRRENNIDVLQFLIDFDFGVEVFKSPNFDAFQQICNTIIVSSSEGFTFGVQILSALFFWVPRSFWDGKGFGTGQYVAELMNYNYTNLSSPIWAEFYVDFGWIGCVISSFFIGFLIKRYSELASGFNIVFVVFLTAYFTYLLRGSLISTLPFLIIFYLVFYFIKERGTHEVHSYTSRITRL